MARSKVVPIPGAIARIRIQVTPAVGRDMIRRGLRVESAAKRRISTSPSRVDTGRLRASIRVTPFEYRGALAVRVGSNVHYARYVHDGTGIYGPKHAPITPKRSKFLRFTVKGSPQPIFARSVKGMRPNPYLRDALPAARG